MCARCRPSHRAAHARAHTLRRNTFCANRLDIKLLDAEDPTLDGNSFEKAD